ncbi:MAG: hypothetical protein MJ058_04270 [Akkermansia sp.]|nr:hypothetical protein [Akkermansia sp.]
MGIIGWEAVEDSGIGGGVGGNFLRLKDGESADVVFLGEPCAVQTCFIEGRSCIYTEALAAKGAQPKTRVRINVLNIGTGSVQIFECGPKTFKQVLILRKRLGDSFRGSQFQIGRTGAGMETTYTIIPFGPASSDVQARIPSLKLHELDPSGSDDASQQAPAPVAEQVMPPQDIFAGNGIEDLKAVMKSVSYRAMMAVFGPRGWKGVTDVPPAEYASVIDALRKADM